MKQLIILVISLMHISINTIAQQSTELIGKWKTISTTENINHFILNKDGDYVKVDSKFSALVGNDLYKGFDQEIKLNGIQIYNSGNSFIVNICSFNDFLVIRIIDTAYDDQFKDYLKSGGRTLKINTKTKKLDTLLENCWGGWAVASTKDYLLIDAGFGVLYRYDVSFNKIEVESNSAFIDNIVPVQKDTFLVFLQKMDNVIQTMTTNVVKEFGTYLYPTIGKKINLFENKLITEVKGKTSILNITNNSILEIKTSNLESYVFSKNGIFSGGYMLMKYDTSTATVVVPVDTTHTSGINTKIETEEIQISYQGNSVKIVSNTKPLSLFNMNGQKVKDNFFELQGEISSNSSLYFVSDGTSTKKITLTF